MLASARFRKLLRAIVVVVFVVVGILLVLPEPPAKPLFGPAGWHGSGGFIEITAPNKELRKSAALDPDTRYWRSWNPETGSQPGTLRSDAFTADDPIGVPYNGFAGEPGINAFVECAGSGKRTYLASSRSNTQWAEIVVDPGSWCDGPVRLVAESNSTTGYVSLGTPYRLGRLSVFKHSTLATAWFLLVAWAAVAGLLAVGANIPKRMSWQVPPVATGLVLVGIAGCALFYLFWFFPAPMRWLGALLAIACAWMGFRVLLGAGNAQRTGDAGSLRWPMLLWLGVALAYLAIGLMGDNGAGPWAMNGRFTPARWSSDNQLPGFVARMLVSGDHTDMSDFGPWRVSDRPPLAYGLHALLHDLYQFLLGKSAGRPLFANTQLAIGVALNSLWVVPVASLLQALGFDRRRIVLLVVVLVCTPFFIFNDLFIWPKLLSGALTLASASLLLGLQPGARPMRESDGDLACAAALAALGLMAHGGSAFGILVAVAATPLFRGLPSVKGSLLAAATALAILVPWSIWQALVQPPGNALVKFAFAGTFGFGEEGMGVIDTISRSYHELGLQGWLGRKADGLVTLLTGARNTCGVQEAGVAHSVIDRWRGHDFFDVIPSLNVLLAGFAVIAFGNASTTARRLVAYGVATIAATWFLTWDCQINHHQSYQALIALHLGLALALFGAGKWGRIALALSVAYGVVVWILEPLNHQPRFDLTAMLMLVAILASGLAWWRAAPAHGDTVQ